MSIITDLSLRWLYRLTDLIHIKCFLVAQLVKNHLQCRRPRFDSWAGKIFCRRDRLPIPGFSGLPGRSDIKESTYNAGDLGSIPELGSPSYCLPELSYFAVHIFIYSLAGMCFWVWCSGSTFLSSRQPPSHPSISH